MRALTASSFVDPKWEWARVAAIAPFLLFPSVMPRATLALLIGWAGLALAAASRQRSREPFNPVMLPAIAVGLAAAAGAGISPFPVLAVPKMAGIALGLIAMRAILTTVKEPCHVWRAAVFYIAVGLFFSASGAVATSWLAKYPVVGRVAEAMPRVVAQLPGLGPAGVQPNALGGTVLLVLPLVGMLALTRRCWADAPARRLGIVSTRYRTTIDRIVRVAPVLVTAVLGTLALLTQSRTAWAALVTTSVTLTAIYRRRWRRVVVALVVITALAAMMTPRDHLSSGWRFAAGGQAASTGISWAGRLELWPASMQAIADFPLTGVGLNAFRRVVHDLYPLHLSPPDLDLAHAHNVFLQTALDIGLPGLTAYLALLILSTRLAWEVYRAADRALGILALGLWGNLLAVHLFGLADAVVLGAKVGVLLWLNIGIIAALHRCTVEAALTARKSNVSAISGLPT